MWSRREIIELLAALPFAAMGGCASQTVRKTPAAAADRGFRISAGGKTSYGTWHLDATCTPSGWRPGTAVDLVASLTLSPEMLPNLVRAVGEPEEIILLLTSERSFDGSGILRLPSDERMSTLLTPGGLAIEGGTTGAISRATGSFRPTGGD